MGNPQPSFVCFMRRWFRDCTVVGDCECNCLRDSPSESESTWLLGFSSRTTVRTHAEHLGHTWLNTLTQLEAHFTNQTVHTTNTVLVLRLVLLLGDDRQMARVHALVVVAIMADVETACVPHGSETGSLHLVHGNDVVSVETALDPTYSVG